MFAITPPVFVVDKLRGNANARHNLFCIRIWRNAPHFDAVRAQEVYEWRYMALKSLLLAIPLLGVAVAAYALLSPSEGYLVAPLAPLFAPLIARLIPGWSRTMEIRGHMIEVLVAVSHYDAVFEDKLRDEINALVTGYPQFSKWSRQRIRSAMMDWMPRAQKWAERNIPPAQ
jgi:hypothetical protein